jgi:hypothetical protein
MADLRVRRQVRELAVQIQRALQDKNRIPWIDTPPGSALRALPKAPMFDRTPGLPEIVERAIREFGEKYRLP